MHPTFYPAVQKLKEALYLLNQYSYYVSLTYLYKIVTKTLTGASLGLLWAPMSILGDTGQY